MKRKSFIGIILLVFLCSVSLYACGERDVGTSSDGHTHTYSQDWSYDSDFHWHKATCSHTSETNGKAAHSFENDECTVCRYKKGGGSSEDPQKVYKTVAFDLNGGKGSLDDMRFAVGEVMAELPSPTRDDYEFVCWTEANEEYTSASVMPDRDLSLTAKWRKILAGYTDEYVTLRPASQGYKSADIYYGYESEVDEFVYVEITSDDLSGKAGTENNFALRDIEGMDYNVSAGYTWDWYQGNFNTPNGAQRFTLYYGSNIQFVTVRDGSGIVRRTYLLDIYVKRDYYINLYDNIFAQKPYDKVRVIENEKFSQDTEIAESEFEFDARVYYNEQTMKYEKFVYSVTVHKDWDLYQTYKPIDVEAETDGGTLDGDLSITPYTRFFTLPSPQKSGYDFLGWQLENGEYLTNVQGYSGINYISDENKPEKLIAAYAPKKYYYAFDGDKLTTHKTVPVVTYTDKTMRAIAEIVYTPYGADCVLPVKTAQSAGEIFTEWQYYPISSGNKFSESLTAFDFDVEITSPVALAAGTEQTSDFVVPLNGEISSGATGTYRMYLPADERYVLTLETTASVTLTVNKYGATNNAQTLTVNSGSPASVNLDYYVYNSGATEYSHGYVTFTVTSCSGTFKAKLEGATARNDGSHAVTDKSNTAAVGEEYTVRLAKPGYAFNGWYSGGEKISENEFITMRDEETEITANWVVCPVTIEKSIDEAGSVSGLSGMTTIGEDVTVTATTKSGYTWVGWYNGVTELTKELNYTFVMPEDSVTYIAKWIKVDAVSNDASAGTVGGLTEAYVAGDSATVTATTKAGYTWVGWYDGGTELTREMSYTFAMPSESATYTAKWIKVTPQSDNTDAGTVTSLGGKYKVGDEVTVTATAKSGYTFLGWYDGETELTREMSYTFAMPSQSATYTAKWTYYTLSTKTSANDGGYAGYIRREYNNQKVTAGATVNLSIVTYENYGYTFLGWYDGDTLLTEDESYEFDMPAENITYTAKWFAYTLTTEVSDAAAGSATTKNAAKTQAGKSVTLTATTNDGYTFLGWYDGAEELTKEASYTFAMPSASVVYTAKWTYYTLSTAAGDAAAGSVTEKNEVKTTAGKSVTLTATTNDGYTFLGWFDGDEELSKNLVYEFAMPSESVVYTAKWISCPVALQIDLPGAGEVVGLDDTTVIGQQITVTAQSNVGYTWVGWYNGEEKLTESKEFTFTLDKDSVVYTAKWVRYTITVNNVEGGTVRLGDSAVVEFDLCGGTGNISAQTVTASEGLEYPAIPVRDGYVFRGWFTEEECVNAYDFSEGVAYSMTLYAGWQQMTDGEYAGRKTVDFTKYGSSSAYYAVSLGGTSSEKPYYLYFTVYGSVNPTLYYRNDSSYYSVYLRVYNVTQNKSIYTDTQCNYSSYVARAIEANAGDVICMTVYRGYGNYYSNLYMYMTNLAKPGSGGTYIGASPAEFGIAAGDRAELTAVTKPGYAWAGWYKGDEKISDDMNISVTMPYENIAYSAKWVKVSLKKSMSEAGSISALDGTYRVGDSVTVTATTKTGYTFVGWFDGDTELSKELSYTFDIPSESADYTAKWIKITLAKSAQGGTVSSLGSTYKAGDSVTVTATTTTLSSTTECYVFVGWFDGETQLSGSLSYTFDMPSESATYTAKWIKFKVQKNNISAGSISTVKGAYLAGANKTLTATTNPGYIWLGWYDDETLLSTDMSYKIAMPSEESVYTAKWAKLTLNKSDDAAGTVTDTDFTCVAGQSVTIAATTNKGYTFLGWYDGDRELTKSPSYTFDVPAAEVSYTAKWEAYTATINMTEGGTFNGLPVRVTLVYNDNYGSVEERYVTNRQLTLPIPGKSGYMFTGWYTNSACTVRYEYGSVIDDNTVLYAGWESPTGMTNAESTHIIDITDGHKSEDRAYSVNLQYTSANRYSYTYFAILSTGQYSLYYKGNGTKQMGVYIYNVTQKSLIKENTFSSASYSKADFNANVGDIIYVRSNLTSTAGSGVPDFCFYVTGAQYPACATATPIDTMNVTAGTSITISAIDKAGYSFLGWYDGETVLTKDASYTFTMPYADVNYKGKWQLNSDMEPFIFESTTEGCTITGVKDKSVTEIVIPDCVTAIGSRAFEGLLHLRKLTIGRGIKSSSFGLSAFVDCYRLAEIYNFSSVKLYAKDTSYGYVAYYAEKIYTEDGESNVTVTDDGYVFYEDENGSYLIDYVGDGTGAGGDRILTLPALSPAGRTYTVRRGAFYKNDVIRSIRFSDGVTAIGAHAFDGSSLTQAVFTDSIKQIGNYAFYECYQLTYIDMGDGIETIGEYAFYDCTRLSISDLPSALTAIGEMAFYRCGQLKHVVIPDGVTVIEKNTFRESGIEYLVIGNGVTEIGATAFDKCFGLTTVTLGKNVTEIGTNAFASCIKIVEIINLSSLSVTQGSTGYGRIAASALNVVKSSANSKITKDSSGYVFYIDSSTAYLIGFDGIYHRDTDGRIVMNLPLYAPGNLTYTIYKLAFCNDSMINSVIIPDTVKDAQGGVFYKCAYLSSVTLGKNITSLSSVSYTDYAASRPSNESIGFFEYCDMLGSVVNFEQVTSIGARAFYQCNELKEITIGRNATYIGEYAFWCHGLESVTFVNTSGWTIRWADDNTVYKTLSPSDFADAEGIIKELQGAYRVWRRS